MDISERRQPHVYSPAALVAAALIAFASPGARAENLLTNGDFSNAFTGWTTVKVIPSFNNLPNIFIFSSSDCVPSQAGNPYASLDVPHNTQARIEQAVELEGDAVLSLRIWGQLQPAEAIISIVDEDGVAHLLDRFVAVRMIQSRTFPGPVLVCTGALPETKSYAVTGFGGQTIKVRIDGAGTGSDGVFVQFDDVELEPAEPSLETRIEVDPAEVELDEEFTLTVKVKNAGDVDLTDVGPTGPVEATSDDGGDVEVLSGPVPTSVATLVAGGTTQFAYQMKATQRGTVKLAVEIAGENEEGDTVVADAVCALPAPARAPGPGRAVAAQTTGCADTVTIGAPCKIELVDESPPLFVARKTGRMLDPGAETPLACSSPGGCKVPKATQEVTRVAEVDIAKLTDPMRQTTKNVGQEVKIKAKVALRDGLTLETLDWKVEGKTIASYTDVSGYTAGDPLALEFSHEDVEEPLEKTTEPDEEGYDTLFFFWKDTGSFEVSVEATAKDENDVEVKCEVDKDFAVVRNNTDPERQPEDFFTSCCAGSPERVRREHETWHARVDNTSPHAGDDWLNFHRAVARVYSQWREFFGYPEVGLYDGSGPFAASEAGFDTTDESRITDTPQCAVPTDPRVVLRPPLAASCTMPGWFTPGGGSAARPLQADVDGSIELINDEPVELAFVHVPQCFAARNYDNDKCFPVPRREDPDPDAPILETVQCGGPEGSTGTIIGLPEEHEVKAGNLILDLAAIGQQRLGDFRDNIELGCVVTKSWHVQMHQLFGGAMMATSTSPKDPVFYRIHQLLSGVTKPGAPTTIYDFWEEEASGSGAATLRSPGTGSASPAYAESAVVDGIAPELTQRFPYPQYPISKLDGVAVAFWEDVTGVDPSDVEVDGQPATEVTGSGKGPYVFRGFPAIGPFASATGASTTANLHHVRHAHGRVVSRGTGGAIPTIVIKAGGIQDASGNLFAGDSWTVPVEPDGDADGVADSVDNCPDVANPLQENSDMYHVHVEGSSAANGEHAGMIFGDELGDACDTDDDDDGFSDATEEEYGSDPQARTSVPDPDELPGDTDGDGTSNANDACFTDPLKTVPGACGCGAPDRDSDGDGTLDCQDLCPLDASKIDPGDCGCAFDEASGENGLACVESITAAPEPVQEIPTLSRWGVVLLALLCALAALRATRSAP